MLYILPFHLIDKIVKNCRLLCTKRDIHKLDVAEELSTSVSISLATYSENHCHLRFKIGLLLIRDLFISLLQGIFGIFLT